MRYGQTEMYFSMTGYRMALYQNIAFSSKMSEEPLTWKMCKRLMKVNLEINTSIGCTASTIYNLILLKQKCYSIPLQAL